MEPSEVVGTDVVQVVPLLGVRSLERRVFDYRLRDPEPVTGAERLAYAEGLMGAVVRIPFGRRRTLGVVIGYGPSGDYTAGSLRTAELVGSERVPPDLLALAERLATYYLAPMGACLQAVVPAHILPVGPERVGRAVAWVTPTGERPVLTSRQEAVLLAVPSEGVAIADLTRSTGAGRGVVEALVDRGALHRETRRVAVGADAFSGPSAARAESDADARVDDRAPGRVRLTEEQRVALAELEEALSAHNCERRLLWGVTGSGKTELYVRLIERALGQGGDAILLVPEIALSGQLVDRLRRGLQRPVAVIHSALGPQRRAREVASVAHAEVRVVVGARSAIFAPVSDLRLVIIDEAHDASYKQQEEPRYDARRVALWRLQAAGGLLVEGTATPRLESLQAVRSPLRLRGRPAGGALPDVEVVDMRRQGAKGLLAPRSRAALQSTLGRGEQAVILLNRRGYAGFLRCGECGLVQMCPHCEISLTYHRERAALLCHHCGYQSPLPAVCPACGGGPLERGAPGTERLRDELLKLVPRSRLFRLDSDIVTSGGRVRDVLDTFAASRPAVLLGTQMVAKGHDFPGVTLVVVADADTALYVPDFRSGERTFQLLTQVAGRAGRGDRPGLVVVQTWNPDVPCIRMAVAQRDEEFYAEESSLRERLGYPPFRELVRLLTVSGDEDRVQKAAEYLADRLRPHLAEDELRGPARMARLRRSSRSQLLIAARDGARARELVGAAVERLRVPYARRGVDLVVDVDPQWFM